MIKTDLTEKQKSKKDYYLEKAEKFKQQIAEDCVLKINVGENRYQFLFEGKPSCEIRTYLKRQMGLKWSPTNKAWQRQITGNARFAIRYSLVGLIELINKK